MAPFFLNNETLEKIFPHGAEKTIREIKEQGFITRKGLYVDGSFISPRMNAEGLIYELNRMDGKVDLTAILAGKDEFIPIETMRKIMQHSVNTKTVEISDACHNFLEKQDELAKCVAKILVDGSQVK